MKSSSKRSIAVIGLGYVGLPVAAAFAQAGLETIGFDIDKDRIEELAAGFDRTNELSKKELESSGLICSDSISDIARSDFYIVTVPTPIDDARRPDMGALFAASQAVGGVLKNGDIVVYESTVYPGATEEDCVPILEQASGLRCGVDFFVGYSPERINPGDKAHRFENICKVVSAGDERTLDIVAKTYEAVVKAGVYRAPSIKTAEAAKVIENSQRDLNIAFVNELSRIFKVVDVDTQDVLDAAATKWNFLRFTPGLVGGHCIGVDPYYLTHKAEQLGYHPEVILAGRRVNDTMGEQVAREAIRYLVRAGLDEPPLVTILGLTFKEDVPDIRNTRVVDIIRELADFGIAVQVHDPLASFEEVRDEYGLSIVTETANLKPADVVILAVPHQSYVDEGWARICVLLKNKTGLVMDLKAALPRELKPDLVSLWRL